MLIPPLSTGYEEQLIIPPFLEVLTHWKTFCYMHASVSSPPD